MKQSNRHISSEVETIARALLTHAIKQNSSYNSKQENPDAWFAYIPTALTVASAQDRDNPKSDAKQSDVPSRE